jgi:hypothetical protein
MKPLGELTVEDLNKMDPDLLKSNLLRLRICSSEFELDILRMQLNSILGKRERIVFDHTSLARGKRKTHGDPSVKADDSFNMPLLLEDLHPGPLFDGILDLCSTQSSSEIGQSKPQCDFKNADCTRTTVRPSYADVGTSSEQEPSSECPTLEPPDQDSEKTFDVLISALEALGDNPPKGDQPDKNGHLVTICPARRSLADAMEQELDKPEKVAATCSFEQRDPESFRKPLGKISNISCSQQPQDQSRVKRNMVLEPITFDLFAPVQAKMNGAMEILPQNMDAQARERITFKISSRKSALGMYQPPWKAEADAQRRAALSTAGLGPREIRH